MHNQALAELGRANRLRPLPEQALDTLSDHLLDLLVAQGLASTPDPRVSQEAGSEPQAEAILAALARPELQARLDHLRRRGEDGGVVEAQLGHASQTSTPALIALGAAKLETLLAHLVEEAARRTEATYALAANQPQREPAAA